MRDHSIYDPFRNNILDEPALRAYSKCSERYNFGGRNEGTYLYRMTKSTWEYITTQTVRKGFFDRDMFIAQGIRHAISEMKLKDNLLDTQLDQLKRQTLLTLNEISQIFKPHEKYLITPTYASSIRVHRTTVDFILSGLYSDSKTSRVHLIDFQPYSAARDMQWDVSLYLKIEYLKNFGHRNWELLKNGKIHAHCFGIVENIEPTYMLMTDQDYPQDYSRRILNLFKRFNTQETFPIIPCPYQCPYKNKCLPEKT